MTTYMSTPKQKKTGNMITGSPVKLILLFAIPLFIGNIFQQIYSAVDTAVAGYCLGDNAIAAIGATSALYSLIIDLASGMNSGCAIVISQNFGANDEDRVKRAVAGTFILNFTITIILTVLSVIFLKPLMKFMNTPDSVFNEAYSYMIVICGAMFFTILYNTFAGILRAVGNSRFPLYCLILASVINMGLDLLFIAVFKWGVAGAAWATIISQAIAGFVCGGYVFAKYRNILPKKRHFCVPKELLLNLLTTGLSMGMMYCLVDIGSVVYQRATNAFGDEIISANTSARRLINIFMQPLSTIATASTTFVGQNWGAGKKDRIKTALKQVLLMEIIWSIVACGLIWLCGSGLVRLTTGTQNVDIISNAVLSMRWHLSFFPALGILLVLRTAMQAMENKVAPLISSGIELVLKVISAFTLIPAIGYLGTCITEPVIWVCMMLCLLIAYIVVRKRLYKINNFNRGEKMYNFNFYMPTKVLFGPGKLNELHNEKLPGKKALIVTSNGTSVKKYGYLARVEKELDLAGIEHTLFDKVRPNPTNVNVMDGAKAVKDNCCDFVIALGGGSVMDCSKCIALMANNTGDIWDYSLSAQGGKKTPENPAIPIVCITTSAGTASEVDIASVISHDEYKEKTGIFFPSMFPTLSVVDSDLMMSVPPKLTAYQGMDAFFHASETVINKNVHPMAEMFALKTIELLAKYLPVAYKDGSNKEARAYVALANSLAGYYMMCTSAHTMEHVMGSFHENLAHGAGLIEIAHSYYDFFAERKAAELPMIKMAKAMGVENATSGKDFIVALDKLIADVGCADLKMSDEGITAKEITLYPTKIHEVLGGDITADPLLLSDKDYLEIYQKAYK